MINRYNKYCNFLKTIFGLKSFKGEFAQNAITLTIGTSIAQTFPMLLYPILSRMFLSADFGLLATLTSITVIIAALSTGKYESSILISKSKQEAANVIGLVLFLSVVFLFITFIGLTLFSDQIALWFKNEALAEWLFICPISAFAIIIYKCNNEWCVKNKYFTYVSYNKITNSASTTLGKVFYGFFEISSNGLILGDLSGRLVSAGWCVVSALNKDKRVFLNITLRNIRKVAKRYIAFPKFSLPGDLIDTINLQLPVFMIAASFGSSEVGYYAMALSVLSVPTSIISIAVMDVFRQRANEEWINSGKCENIYNKAVKMMLIIITPVCVVLAFILPDLFSFLLGQHWVSAGIYARILLPNMAFLFILQVVSSVFIISNKMKNAFIWQVFSISITLISLSIGCFIYKDIKITLLLYIIARSIANSIRLFMTYKYSKGIDVNYNQ